MNHGLNFAEQWEHVLKFDPQLIFITGWKERIWTAIATLTQQGRSVFAYLRDAIHAYLHHQPVPALLPIKP